MERNEKKERYEKMEQILSRKSYVMEIGKNWKQEKIQKGVRFIYPAEEVARGFYEYGFVLKNDTAADLTGWYGFQLQIKVRDFGRGVGSLRGSSGYRWSVTVEFADRAEVSAVIDVPAELLAKETEQGDERTLLLELPLADFPVERVNEKYWNFVTAVRVVACALEPADSPVFCAESLTAVKRKGLYLHVPVRGKSADAGEQVTYQGNIGNCTGEWMQVVLSQAWEGWEALEAELYVGSEETAEECRFLLKPWESRSFLAKVRMKGELPPGGEEHTCLRVTGRSRRETCEAQVTLRTMRRLSHPYLYHNREGWQLVAERIRKYPMYEPAWQAYRETADHWQVKPPIAGKKYCYETKEEDGIMSAAYLYAVTGDSIYGKKLADFFRFFTEKEDGYPARLRGCSQSYVQEGHFFQHLAISYDIICESGLLSADEKKAAEDCFRLYMETLDQHIRGGQISNWLVSEILGGVYCALVLQDLDLAFRFVFGNGGMIQQLQHGLFGDGWWHECSVGYNTWVSSMMLHMAHALLPFGYNLIHAHFPVSCGREVSSAYMGKELPVKSGMYNQKWGELQKNYVCIQDMFDAPLPFLDERGVLFGIADSDEKKLSGVHFGATYDLAYTYYRNPEYIPVMKRSRPDPIFGHPELAEYQSRLVRENACADNIGLALLRSRKKNRKPGEQIQAVLRYGSHGGAHGHFDVTGLLSVMRYGRSFYNPENCWWGYAHFMYKFYVQCSLTKNMVVVDDKMQLPAQSRRILFQSSEKLQAAGIEITTKWCFPPYGGMVYYQDGQSASLKELQKRCQMNLCTLPKIPLEQEQGQEPGQERELCQKADPESGSATGASPIPVYGEMSGYTEEIRQRRILAVTDDYLVLFDYLKGDGEHTFDSLLQIKGFGGLYDEQGKPAAVLTHTEQFCDNPLSDGQFITDCNWYRMKGVTRAVFETVFTEEQAGERLHCDRSNYNEPGALKMDVYTAWPPETEQMVGRVAVYDGWAAAGDGYTVPLSYQILGDDSVLAEGAFNGWILGRGEVDVSLEGVEELVLLIRQGKSQDELGSPVETPQCLFWGSAVLEFADGSVVDIGEVLRAADTCPRIHPENIETVLPVHLENIDTGWGIGRDYKNGRVTIVGTEYQNAIPTSPVDHDRPGRIRICLKGQKARRFRGCVGVDAFAGDEWQKRKTYAVRTKGKEASFITVIEPYEGKAMVQKITAIDEDTVKIELADGRTQILTVENKRAESPHVQLVEHSLQDEV